MIKYIYGLLVCSVVLSSCKKDEDDPVPPAPATPAEEITAVPSSFTQKVLLEIFTGAGQAQCTDGFVKENDIVNTYSSIAIPLRIHYSDAMEIPYYTTMESTFNAGVPPTFPSAMINRTASLGMVILNRTQWMSNFITAKNKTATCGLAIKSSLTGSQATIEVHAGFNQSHSGNYTLTVLLAENNVTGAGNQYDQRNSYNTTAGHAYYSAGDPIVGYSHINTLRKAVSADTGDAITAAALTAGGEFVKSYSVNVSSYKTDDLYIIAFITRSGTSSASYEIMNVQKTRIGTTKNWD